MAEYDRAAPTADGELGAVVEQTPAVDPAEVALDALQARAARLGFNSVTAAFDYLEGIQNGEG